METTSESASSERPAVAVHHILLAGMGAAQGLAFWLLSENWPEAPDTRAVCIGILTFLAVSSAVFHFAWTGRDAVRLLCIASGLGALYAAIAFAVGRQLPGPEVSYAGDVTRATTWATASILTLYVLGPFVQILQSTGRLHFPYPRLVHHAWNNFFIAVVGVVFVSTSWTVLVLWGMLFGLIGVHFFADLFQEKIFVFAVTGAAAGYGIALGRESERVLATLRAITFAVCRGLLPLTAMVALGFVATLPFQGLGGLWESTEHPSFVLLSWVLVTLVFANGRYQDGCAAPPRSRPLRVLLEAGLLALPLFTVIAAYGITLRIGQYGLTPTRFHATLAAVVLSTYGLGYAAAVLRRGSPWLGWIRHVNLVMALVVVVLGLLVHTPLLDPLTLSADDQFRRLAEGRVPSEDFDYGFLRFRLGHAGAARLEDIAKLESHPERAGIEKALAELAQTETYYDWSRDHGPGSKAEDFALAGAREWPRGLFEAVRKGVPQWERLGCGDSRRCVVFPAALGSAGETLYVGAILSPGLQRIYLFAPEQAGGWNAVGSYHDYRAPALTRADAEAFLAAVTGGRFEAAEPHYKDLVVAGKRYRLSER